MHSRQEYSPALLHCAVQPRPIPMSSESAITAAETPAANGHCEAHSTAGFKSLMLGSIGVVYGDIGTSPLYALREAVTAASGGGGGGTPQAGVGGLSLILWAVVIVGALEYILIPLPARHK